MLIKPLNTSTVWFTKKNDPSASRAFTEYSTTIEVDIPHKTLSRDLHEQDFDSDEEQIARDTAQLQQELFLAVSFFVKDQPTLLLSMQNC